MVHSNSIISTGWGARLREERERASLNQDALTGRNTQSAYENERTAPDIRYLAKAESLGLDVWYILSAGRSPNTVDAATSAIVTAVSRLSDVQRDALRSFLATLG